MIKLVQIPDVLGATPLPVYSVPESLDSVILKSVSSNFMSIAVGDLDIALILQDKDFNLKGLYALPNIGAGHQGSSEITWGNTGAYYLAVHAGVDRHHVPMQSIVLQGGDIISWIGNSDPTGGWLGLNLWVEVSELSF